MAWRFPWTEKFDAYRVLAYPRVRLHAHARARARALSGTDSEGWSQRRRTATCSSGCRVWAVPACVEMRHGVFSACMASRAASRSRDARNFLTAGVSRGPTQAHREWLTQRRRFPPLFLLLLRHHLKTRATATLLMLHLCLGPKPALLGPEVKSSPVSRLIRQRAIGASQNHPRRDDAAGPIPSCAHIRRIADGAHQTHRQAAHLDRQAVRAGRASLPSAPTGWARVKSIRGSSSGSMERPWIDRECQGLRASKYGNAQLTSSLPNRLPCCHRRVRVPRSAQKQSRSKISRNPADWRLRKRQIPCRHPHSSWRRSVGMSDCCKVRGHKNMHSRMKDPRPDKTHRRLFTLGGCRVREPSWHTNGPEAHGG